MQAVTSPSRVSTRRVRFSSRHKREERPSHAPGGGSGGSFAARALGFVVLRDHFKQCPRLGDIVRPLNKLLKVYLCSVIAPQLFHPYGLFIGATMSHGGASIAALRAFVEPCPEPIPNFNLLRDAYC